MGQAPQTIAVINPQGQLGDIPIADAHRALSNGFRIAEPTEVHDAALQAEHGEGVGNAAAAFGEGALSGVTLGLSRQFENASGITTPEAQAARAKFNPISSTAGEITGIAAPLAVSALAGPEGPAAVIAGHTPVGLLGRAAEGVTSAVAPITEGFASGVVNAEASPVIHKILSQGLAHGAGSAIEGAAFGLGESVNEDALGKAPLNAEHIMANVGYGALYGGALGTLFGSIAKAHAAETAEQAAQREFSGVAERPGADGAIPTDLKSAADHFGLDKESKAGLMDGLKKEKPNAEAIKAAAEELNAPILEGIISDSPVIQRTEDLLTKSNSAFGIARQQKYAQAYGAAEDAVKSALGDATTKSAAEAGNELKEMLTAKIESEAKPIEEMYSYLKEAHSEIPLNEKGMKQISGNIRKLEGVELSPSSPEAILANRVADEIENLKTVDQVKQYKSILNRSGSPETRYIRGRIAEKLDSLEERSIMRFAEDNARSLPSSDKIVSLIEQHKETKSLYRAFRAKMEDLGSVLGKKKIYGKQDFIDFLERLTPEKLSEKLFTKKNSEFLTSFKTNFPQEFEIVRKQEIGKMASRASKGGDFSVKSFAKEFDGLQKETREALFSPEQMKRIEAAKTYVEAFPKDFNPSHTASAAEALKFFSSPLAFAGTHVRDAAMMKFIKTFGAGGGGGSQVKGLTQIERMTQATGRRIKDTTKAIFDGASEGTARSAGLMGAFMARDKHEKGDAHEKALELSSDPQALINKLDEATRDLNGLAPNITGHLQVAAARATNFLASVAPRAPQQGALSSKFPVPKSEIAKFNRYYQIVQDPLLALDHVKNGTLTKEGMQALVSVYPELYSEMRDSVTDQLTKYMGKKEASSLPYATKMSLSMFLNEDMVDSLASQNIAMNQIVLNSNGQAQATQDQQNAVKVSQNGLSKIDSSARLLTATQATAQR